jgi:PAT family beta-lactamase induction signal transducer AmpG
MTMANPTPSPLTPWRWIPSLYFAQGIPYVVVMTLSVVMYKNLKVSNTDIALYTSWLYLPWVIKPLWSPVVELYQTKRCWIVGLQFVIGAALAAVALTLPGPDFFRYSLAVLWLLAFSSATHDIAADGFYLLALPPNQQAAFVGVRSTFYRVAMIAGQGGLVWLAGYLQQSLGSVTQAWAWVFLSAAAFFLLVGLYHHLIALPRPAVDQPAANQPQMLAGWIAVFAAFFRKRDIGLILGFLLLYRFAEAQLLKLVTPFLLDPRPAGGLGLTTQQVGIIYGTMGIAALTVGGVAGGVAISRFGLKRMLWPMILAMYAPNVAFIFLALAQPENLALIGAALAVEQFGYGFGFTAYLVYMMMVAAGEHKTAHYAICTGFMALGMMLPGMAAGWIQEHLGYVNFFLWVCVATIPSFAATALIKVDPAFGRKTAPASPG